MEHSRSSFSAVRNRIKMHHQHECLSSIIEKAGAKLQSKNGSASDDCDGEVEIRHVIGSATFLMSTISYILSSADRNELECSDINELIQQAETMTGIMSAVFH